MPGIEDLKVEDVVITSTPQSRRADAPAPETAPAPAKPGEEELPGEEEEVITPGEEEGEEEPGEEEESEEEEAPSEQEEEDYQGGEIDLEALSEEVGLELQEEGDVIDALKELAEYKALSPALQQAIEIERNQGDVAAYFRTLANDPKDLSDRDALWEQYKIDNPKRIATNSKFAQLDFDRRLEKEYSLLLEYEKLSASDQEDFLEEHKDEIDYLKEKRKFDAETARASLQETREKAKFYPVATGEMDEEKAERTLRTHEEGYKKALAEFEVVSISLGDDFEFNIGMSESNRKIATDWVRNPDRFLAELGFTKEKINYEQLAGWATLIADIKYGNFGERFRQALLDNKDISTLEGTLDAPGIVKTAGDKPIIQGDEWDQVGDAFEKQRLAKRKK